MLNKLCKSIRKYETPGVAGVVKQIMQRRRNDKFQNRYVMNRG